MIPSPPRPAQRLAFHDLARALLRAANRHGERAALLRALSALILDFTQARALTILFEDGPGRYRWRLEAGGGAPLHRRGARGRAPAAAERARLTEALGPPIERSRLGDLWADQLLIAFEIDEQDRGALRLEGIGADNTHPEQREIYAGLAPLLGAALAHRRAQAALKERVKELTCMYRLAQIGTEADRDLEDALREIVGILPAAWQFPSRARARITLDAQAFCSPGFEEGAAALRAGIQIQGVERGVVELFYIDAVPLGAEDEPALLGEAAFLEDEGHLINGVARELAFIIERRCAERERARLQDQIRHADRLATIGQLAAGVAHELNEPLGNILGFAQLAAKTPQLPTQAQRDLDQIVTGALYAREIIKKLMFFSRQTPARRVALDLNEVIEEALGLLSARSGQAGVQLQRALSPGLPQIEGDPAQLQQVFVNLLVNALQATPEGGSVRVGSRRLVGARLLAWVEDTGEGIEAEAIKKIFLPFFTTKDVGQGTGLGLSVVHGIITAHGGEVRVKSARGAGARFEVELPIKEGARCGHPQG
ncbi:hypothetical protein KKF91_13760 [Myxococcota bacterium]|nr:hypothetical protein [Myxococcota bacterium]